MNERQFYLAKVIQKIPVFAGFQLPDIQRLLRVAELSDFDEGDDVYLRDEPSDEMLVLLRGRLSVQGEGGEELAQIGPGRPTGEMGVFTGARRSASIVAVQDSTAIIFNREHLMSLLEANQGMYVKVLRNLVGILCERLADANSLNESNSRIIRDLERQLDGDEDAVDDEDDEDDEAEEEDDADA